MPYSMKQLPPDCIMDRWLARGAITPELLKKLPPKSLISMPRPATNPEIAAFGKIETIRGKRGREFHPDREICRPGLSAEHYREIQGSNRRFMENRLPLFHKRIADGKIRDCHGDLHLQHICLGKEILIFDCIEFNQRFRYSDVAADIAFLLMDLDYHGEPLLSADLASHYLKISQDWPLFLLLNFYKSYRAYVRAKVTCFRLEDPVISAARKKFGPGRSQTLLQPFPLLRPEVEPSRAPDHRRIDRHREIHYRPVPCGSSRVGVVAVGCSPQRAGADLSPGASL